MLLEVFNGVIETFFPTLNINLVEGGETSIRVVILGQAYIKTCRCEAFGRQSKQKTRQPDPPPTRSINVSWLCQMGSDVFTAFAVLFRKAKRDKLS